MARQVLLRGLVGSHAGARLAAGPCVGRPRRAASALAPPRPGRPGRSSPPAPHGSSGAAESPSAEALVPLCERPGAHVSPLGPLADFWAEALGATRDAAPTFAGATDPGLEDLVRDLRWLVEDSVVAVRPRGGSGGGGWQEVGGPRLWRELPLEDSVAAAGPAGGEDLEVLTRVTVGELRGLWGAPPAAPCPLVRSILPSPARPFRQWHQWRLTAALRDSRAERRLRERAPLQYLTNTSHWRDLVLAVGPGALIPRPETELLPELALAAVQARPALGGGPWADLGTGSGALALALAGLLPPGGEEGGGVVWAVDLSPAAADIARNNARRILATRAAARRPGREVRVVEGSWFGPLDHLKGQLCGVVCNPPYIPRADMESLQAEVGRHEPWSALDGGEGPGLDDLREVCRGAAEALAPGGFIGLETNGGAQAHQVAGLLDGALGGGQFREVQVVKDLTGIDRFVTASRAG